MANRRELVVAIVSDASQFNKGFDQATRGAQRFGKQVDQASKSGLGQLNSRVGAVTAGFGDLAKVAGGLVVGRTVFNFAKDSISEFSNLEESINAVNVSFGDSASGVLDLGKNAADSLGLANSEFNQLSVSLAGFTEKIAGASNRDVVEVLDELTTRAADFASVMNLDVNDAVNKFRSGLAGEAEPLRQFNIDLSAAAVNAKALELGLAESTAELDESDKVLARYTLLMEDTSKAAGDFANTSDGLANSQRILQARLKDAQATIGRELAPAMAKLIDAGIDLIPVIAALSDVIANASDQAKPLLDLLNILDKVIGDNSDTAEGAAESVGILGRTWDALTRAVNPVGALYSDITGEIDENNKAQEEAAEKAAATGAAMSASADEVLRLKSGFEQVSDTDVDLDDQTDAFEETKLAVQDARLSIEAYEAAFRRLTDPVFRAIDDQNRLTSAFESYTDAVKEFGPGSREAVDAGFDLAEAQEAANSSAALLPDTMARSEDAIAKLADQADIAEETLAGMEDQLDSIDGKTARAELELFFKTVGLQSARDAVRSGSGATRDGITRYHSGGVVPGPRGSDQLILAAGGETVLPTHRFPNAGLAMGGDRTYHFNFEQVEPQVDAQRVAAVYSVMRREEAV